MDSMPGTNDPPIHPNHIPLWERATTSTDQDELHRLAVSPITAVRLAVARNPHISDATRERLAARPDAALYNQDATVEQIDRLASWSPMKAVQHANLTLESAKVIVAGRDPVATIFAAGFPGFPGDMVEAWAESKSMALRLGSLLNPALPAAIVEQFASVEIDDDSDDLDEDGFIARVLSSLAKARLGDSPPDAHDLVMWMAWLAVPGRDLPDVTPFDDDPAEFKGLLTAHRDRVGAWANTPAVSTVP